MLLLGLAGCGGSDDTAAYDAAVARANRKEADSRALGDPSPCASSSQCGVLSYRVPVGGSCVSHTYKVYSLVSASAAAASAAAAEQTALAEQARALAPPSDAMCPAVIATPPTPACTANACAAS